MLSRELATEWEECASTVTSSHKHKGPWSGSIVSPQGLHWGAHLCWCLVCLLPCCEGGWLMSLLYLNVSVVAGEMHLQKYSKSDYLKQTQRA